MLSEVRDTLRSIPDGNASSPHTEGRAARAALDRARDTAASALGIERTAITFTTSGTEAVNLALFGAARRLNRKAAIVTWTAEHQSVLGAVRKLQADGHAVKIANVDRHAIADVNAITPDVGLVSISVANNEVGTIQPVTDIVQRAHEIGAVVHVDACSAARWLSIAPDADLVSISGHKIGAGRGGVLAVKDGVRIDPLLFGGPQEWGRRAGFEDVSAAIAVAVALEVCERERDTRSITAARQSARLRDALASLGAQLTGADRRLPNSASCTFAGRRGEDMLVALDLAGIAASSGSACASGSLDPSHVLLAMGLNLDQARGSLRLTTGYATTDAEIDRAIDILNTVLSPVRARN